MDSNAGESEFVMGEETRRSLLGWIWGRFQGSWLWHVLKRVSPLRSSYYLAIELRDTLRAPREGSPEVTDAVFIESIDPWKYETNALEQERFALQTALLDEVRRDRLFASGLEIGCAEGLFTEVIADRCASLLVLDLSPTALARTEARRPWSDAVRFEAFDLRDGAIPGQFDLIVIAGVLEYFTKRKTFVEVRNKLCAALRPNGYLLVETTRKNPVTEEAWFGKAMIRGKWVNWFIAQHPSLSTASQVLTEKFAITLLRKNDSGSTK